MHKFFLTAAFVAAPFAAVADSQTERLEDLTIEMTRVMWGMLAMEAEKEGGNGDPMRAAIAKFEWTDALDSATGCIVDRYNDAVGRRAVDDMFDRMETMIAEMDGLSLDEFTERFDETTFLPDGLTEDDTREINESCGMTDAQLDAMQATGFTAAMMGAMADG